MLVVPGGLAGSAWLAWTAQRAAFRAGWNAADSTALALYLLPLLWTLLVSWQMTRGRIAAMAAVPIGCLALGGMLWVAA